MRDDENSLTFYPSSLIPHPLSPVAAILLAAGRSRRMGAFKPLLPFGEKTVAETVVENLLAAGTAEIVCVVGHRAAELRARLAHLPVKFALNEEAESEMGVSIARGVESVSEAASAALVALVDQPAVPVASIRQVANEHLRHGARLVVPTWQGRGGHPVLVSLDFREELRRLDARRGLRALFDSYRDEVRRVEVESPFVARDMDTWDDYCALHLEVFGVVPPSQKAVDEDGQGV
ncbi:MAG: nucleotidyltransferase family protein [Pyrinomonadaceae bacterium]|nr:nucleotidyltransferase family protein [Pyrinomonadaceae bacterium]